MKHEDDPHQSPKVWGDTVTDAICDDRVFADETCDHECRVIGRDRIHRCMDAIQRLHPDGCGPELLGFYLGVSRQSAEMMVKRYLALLPTADRRILEALCDAA